MAKHSHDSDQRGLAPLVDDMSIYLLSGRVSTREAPGVAGDERIAEAMAALRAGKQGTDEASAVSAEYRLAGEVLSRGLESGGESALASQMILNQRLAREAEILGDFALVARD